MIADWLAGWLAGRPVDWLTDWLTDLESDWPDWLDWLTDWLTGLLADWLADRLTDWLIDAEGTSTLAESKLIISTFVSYHHIKLIISTFVSYHHIKFIISTCVSYHHIFFYRKEYSAQIFLPILFVCLFVSVLLLLLWIYRYKKGRYVEKVFFRNFILSSHKFRSTNCLSTWQGALVQISGKSDKNCNPWYGLHKIS